MQLPEFYCKMSIRNQMYYIESKMFLGDKEKWVLDEAKKFGIKGFDLL